MKEEQRHMLELPNVYGNEGFLSLEDKIMVKLYKEKGLNIDELKKLIKGSLSYEIKTTITRAENKGFIIGRLYNGDTYYYLTMHGCYELQYRYNTLICEKLLAELMIKGYDKDNIVRFISNRFYTFYLEGEFNYDTLSDQYISWCNKNILDPYAGPIKKLQKNN